MSSVLNDHNVLVFLQSQVCHVIWRLPFVLDKLNGETCRNITDNADQLISCVSTELPPNSSEHYNISTLKSRSFNSNGCSRWTDMAFPFTTVPSLQQILGKTRTYASMEGLYFEWCCVDEEWQENFQMCKANFYKLCGELCPFIEKQTTVMRLPQPCMLCYPDIVYRKSLNSSPPWIEACLKVTPEVLQKLV